MPRTKGEVTPLAALVTAEMVMLKVTATTNLEVINLAATVATNNNPAATNLVAINPAKQDIMPEAEAEKANPAAAMAAAVIKATATPANTTTATVDTPTPVVINPAAMVINLAAMVINLAAMVINQAAMVINQAATVATNNNPAATNNPEVTADTAMAILANSTTATADILIPVMLNLAATVATNNLVVTTTITVGVVILKVATLNPETVNMETTTVMVVAAVLMAGNSQSLANPLKL